jgi:hypothetical protein
MGNVLITVRDGLEKDAEGASKAAQEKLDHFYATISQAISQLLQSSYYWHAIRNDSVDTKLLPIGTVLDHWTFIDCINTNEDNISGLFKQAINVFTNTKKDDSKPDTPKSPGNSFTSGLANLGATIIKRLLGSSAGEMKVETR